MPKKTFAVGEVLTSSDVNAYLMNQSVMVFASAAARTTAIPSPTQGMVTYLSDTNTMQTYSGSAWANSINQSVATSAKPTFAGVDLTAYSTYPAGDNSRFVFGPNSTWGAYLHIGATTNKSANAQAQVIATNGNLHIDCGSSQDIYLNYYSSGRPIQVFGAMTFAANTYIGLNSGVTDANSISCSGWFRSTGDTGIYMQTYGGGWHMTDSTWMRNYNSKNLYSVGEIRTNGSFSSNVSRQRGSYGAITVGSNGRSNTWGGIEFVDPEKQTFMVQEDNYSGMYKNNNEWNWLWLNSSLIVGSDERFKREIEPLSLGLNFLEQLEPVSFLKLTERTDDDPDATQDGYYYGFTAQNVRAALDAVGETRDVRIHDIGGPDMGLIACTEDAVYDRQYIGVTEFLAPIVQAIKELNEKVKALEGAQ